MLFTRQVIGKKTSLCTYQKMANLLVSCQWLKEQLDQGNPEICLLDCHYAPGSDYFSQYNSKHIPGAVHFDIEKASYKTKNVPRQLYAPEQFEEYVQSLGVDNCCHVIVYDHSDVSAGFFSATRAWWLFKLYGHDRVSVLDGGLQKWPYDTSNSEPHVKKGGFKAKWNDNVLATFDEFLSSLEKNTSNILDARPARLYTGAEVTSKPPGITGTFIPNTINVPVTTCIRNGVCKDKNEILEALQSLGMSKEKPIITLCNSAMASSGMAFFCTLAGFESVKNYNGAMAEIIQVKPEIISGVYSK